VRGLSDNRFCDDFSRPVGAFIGIWHLLVADICWKHLSFCSALSADKSAQYGVDAKESIFRWRSVAMNMRTAARMVMAVLWSVFLARYITAKIHFFTSYDSLRVGPTFKNTASIGWGWRQQAS
jgi:hypothetical protein